MFFVTAITMTASLSIFFVTIVSVMYRSDAIARPTANTINIGYMNTPPVEKKLIIE